MYSRALYDATMTESSLTGMSIMATRREAQWAGGQCPTLGLCYFRAWMTMFPRLIGCVLLGLAFASLIPGRLS